MSEALSTLKGLNVAAVGISPDSPKRQKRFDQKFNLGFPLLADEDRAVADAFGALGYKTVGGEQKQAIIRSSFLIDESGQLLAAWYRVKPEDTVPTALEVLHRNS